MAATSTASPMGVKLKKLNGSIPARDSSVLTARLGGVPIRGMNMATAPVLLMKADNTATTSINSFFDF